MFWVLNKFEISIKNVNLLIKLYIILISYKKRNHFLIEGQIKTRNKFEYLHTTKCRTIVSIAKKMEIPLPIMDIVESTGASAIYQDQI